jgi:hypothetical protein
MSGSRILLIAAAILFVLAALTAGGALSFTPVAVLALLAFACWAGAGAV